MARWKSTTLWSAGRSPVCGAVRQLKGRKAAIVVAAVEKRGGFSGRIRMAVIPDFKQTKMIEFPARRPIVLKRRQMIASLQQAERLEVHVKQIAILIAICLIPVPLRPQEHSPTTRTSGNSQASGEVTLGERLAR